MLIRFVAGSFVACIAIAIASAGMLLFSGLNPQRFALIVSIWCLVPCAWGLWAMLSPTTWMPQRLPVWGMILGIVAALMGIFVLNLPYRVLGIDLPAIGKVFSLAVAALIYYLLWAVVRTVYMRLSGASAATTRV